jgi:hypothetical protein
VSRSYIFTCALRPATIVSGTKACPYRGANIHCKWVQTPVTIHQNHLIEYWPGDHGAGQKFPWPVPDGTDPVSARLLQAQKFLPSLGSISSNVFKRE